MKKFFKILLLIVSIQFEQLNFAEAQPFLYSASNARPQFQFDNCIKFDGVNDFIQLNKIVNLNPKNGFAFSLWFKVNNAFIFNGTRPPAAYLQTLSDGRVIINSGTVWNNTSGRNNTTWYHLFVCGVSSDSAKVFVNGVEISDGTKNIAGFSWDITNFAKKGVSVPSYYSGYIDEIAFWNKGFYGQAEADLLYNSGNGQYADKVIPYPVAYYRANGVIGDTLFIDETYQHQGTLKNCNTSTCWQAH